MGDAMDGPQCTISNQGVHRHALSWRYTPGSMGWYRNHGTEIRNQSLEPRERNLFRGPGQFQALAARRTPTGNSPLLHGGRSVLGSTVFTCCSNGEYRNRFVLIACSALGTRAAAYAGIYV
jgi:hypothetical protein